MGPLERPVLLTRKDIEAMFDQVLERGVNLIENSASLGAEFALHLVMEYSKSRKIPIIVEDIFDTLPVYLTHLELMGVSVEDSDMRVIKVGGNQEAGNVLARVCFENDPHIYRRKIDRELEKIIPEGDYIHMVLGLERLLSIQNNAHTIHAILSPIKHKLCSDRGRSVYIVEKPLMENLPFNPLPLLEDVATSVIELVDEGEGVIRTKLKKSQLKLVMQKQAVLVSPREVLRWWE